MKAPLLLTAYRTCSHCFGGLYHLLYRARVQMGKEDPKRILERAGYSNLERPDGSLIWLHGASVGECILAMALIKEISKASPDIMFLLTSQTRTSAQMVEGQAVGSVIHQYLPMDTPDAMNRFIAHWQPNLLILLESEIWPNLILSVRKRNIPLVLFNARMNVKSQNNWRKRKQTAKYLFNQFQWILAADQTTCDLISDLSDHRVSMIGNLKQIIKPAPPDPNEVKKLQLLCKERPVWLAASTHHGEDEILLQAHKQILKIQPEALLILVPRHPQRGSQIAMIATEFAMSNSLRSVSLQTKNQVWIADTIGEMPLWLSLSSIAFIAGSLHGGKGHNPLEALAASVPVLSGSSVSSFSKIYQDLDARNAVQFCDTPSQIAAAILAHFDNPSKSRKSLQSAQNWMTENASEMIASIVPPLLDLLNEGENARS